MNKAQQLLDLLCEQEHSFKNKQLKDWADNANGFPDEFLNLKKGTILFVYSYPDLDAALNGMNVIARPTFIEQYGDDLSPVLIVSNAKGLRAGDHVFLGLPRLKGLAKGFVEGVKGNFAAITGMSTRLEK